jgi:hypothetical protein
VLISENPQIRSDLPERTDSDFFEPAESLKTDPNQGVFNEPDRVEIDASTGKSQLKDSSRRV